MHGKGYSNTQGMAHSYLHSSGSSTFTHDDDDYGHTSKDDYTESTVWFAIAVLGTVFIFVAAAVAITALHKHRGRMRSRAPSAARVEYF